jgi:hypothetical protein
VETEISPCFFAGGLGIIGAETGQDILNFPSIAGETKSIPLIVISAKTHI